MEGIASEVKGVDGEHRHGAKGAPPLEASRDAERPKAVCVYRNRDRASILRPVKDLKNIAVTRQLDIL